MAGRRGYAQGPDQGWFERVSLRGQEYAGIRSQVESAVALTPDDHHQGPPRDAARFCPLCGSDVNSETCPDDGVRTVPIDVLSARGAAKLEGAVLAERFRVGKMLGEGGMGRVYQAQQVSVGRPVAVKTLHPDGMRTRADVLRFFREARASSRMRSAHVVRVLDFGFDEATCTPFIAMELLEGDDLGHALQRDGPMPLARACSVLAGIADALAEAESLGVVHRDLKPENIMLCRGVDGSEVAKVTDFGIAKLLNDVLKLTMSGARLGTPAFMPPEQISDGRVDRRSDLYALGCMLHMVLTGRPPFASPDVLRLLHQHLSEPPPSLPDPLPCDESLPPVIARLYEDLLAKEPEDRPESAAVVRDILRAAIPASEQTEGQVTVSSPAPMPTVLPWVALALGLALSGCLFAASVLWLALRAG